MFEYVEEKLSLKIGDKVYPFRQPTIAEQRSFSKNLKTLEGDEGGKDAFDYYMDFFLQLGVPQEAVDKLSPKGLMDLFSYSVGAKKN